VLIGAVTVAVIAGAAAFVWVLVLRDTSEPAKVDDAVRRFRDAAQSGGTPAPPGVYVYATTGQESISALGGTTHRYPRRSTITVTSDPCGMSLRWDVLTTRTNTYTVCAERDGQRLARWSERHRFFGQDDRSDWRCTGTPWLPAPDEQPRYRCSSPDTDQEGSLTVVGEEQVVVSGIPVDAVHLRIEATEAGAARGPLVEERWLEPETGLPLRIVYRVRTENDSPIGDVTFEERYELRLLSLEPRR
jgi:hypothetical protein